MFTARKLVSACAGVALLADRWPQWLVARDRIFLTAPSPSFREACLQALRDPSVGLGFAADELLAIEADGEVARGDGVRAIVDELA
jgi:hypothetical protein